MLASGTVITGPLANHALDDRLAAGGTGLAGTAIDAQLLTKIARPSLAVLEVPQGGATGQDGLFQYLADGLSQTMQTLTRDATRRASRVDPGREQGLAGVDIAHPDHGASIHDVGLDGLVAAVRTPVQIVAVESGIPGLRPQPA